MNTIEFVNKVAGKPWEDRMSGPDSYDCWGLVVASFLSIDGVDIGSVDGYQSGGLIEDIGNTAKDAFNWPQIDKPLHGAVFCVSLANGTMIHVGRILYISGCGLRAVHAAGKDGKGQVAVETIQAINQKYGDRITYYMRPQNA